MPIDYKIEDKKFKVIGDQIGAILKLEFKSQVDLFQNAICEEVEVYRERIVPIDNTEMIIVNVSYGATRFDNKHQASSDGNNTYLIEVTANAPSRTDKRGDLSANMKLQKVLGIIWETLEHPMYKTLGFDQPSVSHSMVTDIEISSTRQNEDALNTVEGVLTFTCKHNEKTGLMAANEIEMNVAEVKLGLTDKGYRYEYIKDEE